MLDALNLWDFVKAFGRGMRWLLCGVKKRKDDISYKLNHHHHLHHHGDTVGMTDLPDDKEAPSPYKAPTTMTASPDPYAAPHHQPYNPRLGTAHSERAGLMAHAQPYPGTTPAQAQVADALWGPRPAQP
ncbi:hypothetical protein CDD83_1731 [Cordyceps sp. RAO-2017]|nr:hypothetical protein CDD83_1731 [Cordyceps sp. RAO-2017]